MPLESYRGQEIRVNAAGLYPGSSVTHHRILETR